MLKGSYLTDRSLEHCMIYSPDTHSFSFNTSANSKLLGYLR